MALTDAERQRRYIARLKAKAATTNEPVTNVTHDLVVSDEDVYAESEASRPLIPR